MAETQGNASPVAVRPWRGLVRSQVSRSAMAFGAVLVCGALAGCSTTSMTHTAKRTQTAEVDPELGVAPSPRVVEDGKPVPKGGGRFTTGKGYKIGMKTFTPTPVEPKGYTAVGLASYYGTAFHGRRTANGEVFDQYAYTAAHPTLPLPSYVRVTNLSNNRSMIVRVNDRGPFHRGRLIDVSKNTADALGFRMAGVGRVKIEYVGLASLQGSDDRKLLATLTENGRPVNPGAQTTQVAGLFQPPPPPAPPPPRPQFGGAPPMPPAMAVASVAPAPAMPARQPALRPAVYTGAPAPMARPVTPAPAAYGVASAYAPAPVRAPAPRPVTHAAPLPEVAVAEAAPPPPETMPPVAAEPSPTASSGNAHQRILLSWGGLTAPAPLAAGAPSPELPASATALSAY